MVEVKEKELEDGEQKRLRTNEEEELLTAVALV